MAKKEAKTYQILENPPTAATPTKTVIDEDKTSTAPPKKPAGRLLSLDAFRGFIMLLLAAHGFGIAALARTPADNELWQILDRPTLQWISFHFTHPDWQSSFVPGTRDPAIGSPWLHVGVSFWDLIQPAFMFMVGVSLPFSMSRRESFGQNKLKRILHSLTRSATLVLMGVFLYSLSNKSTHWIFPNVLAQIGLGYFWVTLLVGRRRWVQIAAMITILVGTWVGIHTYTPPADASPEAVNARVEKGEIYAPPYRQWSKNLNAFHAFDVWFLNQFPRPSDVGEFKYNGGGYQTLNFVPAMATMILGLLCGELLLASWLPRRKFWTLVLIALGCWAFGIFLGATCCPIVKKIWTPSWVLFSGGYVVGMLAIFYLLFDILPFKRLAFPFVVVGTNSLLVYFMGELITKWLAQNVNRHFGWAIDGILGWIASTFHILNGSQVPPEEAGAFLHAAFQPVISATSAVIAIWLLCYWLYRQRIFIRV